MKKIAIVGAGPTGIYTLFSLLQQQTPLSISIFEQADEAGVGMPYSDEENSKLMLFIKTIADSGSNIVFTFNGDGEANSFAVMICQCGASPWPENN